MCFMIRDSVSRVKSSLQNWQQFRGENFFYVVQKNHPQSRYCDSEKKNLFPTGLKVAILLIYLAA